jgi:hypothetical protein
MTMDIFLARNRSAWGRLFDAGTEDLQAHAAECRELAHRWHEESKARYEELTRQRLELAEQRQRCA